MTTPVEGHATYKFRCPECNWSQIIATAAAPPAKQCAWCGWTEIAPIKAGAFASFNCDKHGLITCIVEDEGISSDDFMDLFCPHCDD